MYSLFAVVGITAAFANAQGNWQQFKDPYSAARGNCPDCAAGEAKAETTVVVPHGVYVDIDNPPCGNAEFNAAELPDPVKAALASAFYEQVGPFANFAVDLGQVGVNALINAGVNDAGTLGKLMRSVTNQPQVANCTRLVVALPKSVTITRVEKATNCPGWCAWVSEPTSAEVDGNLFSISAVMKNWSHDSDRSATLRVYYKR